MSFQISAVVITRNEERNIARCLESLQGVADEVLVLDSGSTDGTIAIAQALGANVHQLAWQGYGPTKNHGHALAKYDWILSLDADEALSPELKQSLLQLKATDLSAVTIGQVNRLSNYLGRWMHYSGWQPDYCVRLFHRYFANWNSSPVHEVLEYKGEKRIQKLAGNLLHYTLPTIADHLATINRYSSLHAERYVQAGKRFRYWHIWIAPWWKFLNMYLVKRGFLDGREGFWLAYFSAFDRLVRALKHRELEKARKAH
jgi:glycosyltransferase involved in cell wall biosynthesis